jgi:hypothetical protein
LKNFPLIYENNLKFLTLNLSNEIVLIDKEKKEISLLNEKKEISLLNEKLLLFIIVQQLVQ